MPAARKSSPSRKTKEKAGRKLTLSPTRIATYLECAVKYRYIYQDKIGKFYLRSRSYFSFGTSLHHVLEEFHAQGTTHTAEEIVTELKQGWVSAGYETPEQERKHQEAGEQIVQAYHAAHQERAQAAVETLATEKTITCDMGDFKLSGRIDRLDRHADGRLEIVDYKSGRWDVTAEEVASDLAMNCYQLILRHLYPDTPIFATIYCLRSGNQASATLEGAALSEFEQDIRVIAEDIQSRDWNEVKPIRLDICADCDFLTRCERYWRLSSADAINDGPLSENGV